MPLGLPHIPLGFLRISEDLPRIPQDLLGISQSFPQDPFGFLGIPFGFLRPIPRTGPSSSGTARLRRTWRARRLSRGRRRAAEDGLSRRRAAEDGRRRAAEDGQGWFDGEL